MIIWAGSFIGLLLFVVAAYKIEDLGHAIEEL